jgi:RHS repeat-associated protein
MADSDVARERDAFISRSLELLKQAGVNAGQLLLRADPFDGGSEKQVHPAQPAYKAEARVRGRGRQRLATTFFVTALVAITFSLISTCALAGTVTYIYTDPQGTPLAEADAAGNITATFDYKPYGSLFAGTPPSGPGFIGGIHDTDTDLAYLQARYYDSASGRFLSADPIVSVGGETFHMNRYAYGNNNPVSKVDPTGLSPLEDQGPGVIGVDGEIKPSGAMPIATFASMLPVDKLPSPNCRRFR